ncbi:molecular chaperone Hsp90 [Peptostreptococcus sp. MV1]|uniref:molecular chaperone HtpG n=1 Tax=Peptostreptococcus sp. MV1 TaxID=1219626 RepID=UPI00050E099F|nr:molecular chaperone HtpG [Peptostreptococcus sp. MV1]KGF10538.1 molecular chaperone Hsp90 [Peptostreptococcus sp. MV1]
MTTEKGKVSIHSENIFPIIKKWLYSDKDIFVRELVSNGCDAIAKHKRLAGMGEAELRDDYKVIVRIDRENRTLTFTDNGIGMDLEEVKKYINQVAFSGAEEFVNKYKDRMDESNDIIGHFGLGFYSAFMVSSKVEISTLSYKDGAQPVSWISEDGMEFEIGQGDRKEHGTSIILTIPEENDEFLYAYKIREILNKYCYFLPTEIYLEDAGEEKRQEEERAKKAQESQAKYDEAVKNGQTPEPIEVDLPEEAKPINNIHPLWMKTPKDCTEDDYKAFYKEVFHTHDEPLFWIHLNVDFPFNLKGILYFPKLKNEFELVEGQVKLYNNQVFVADNIKEVIPEFLLLLKGVIDCPDLPLNVSRSFLQNDRDVSKISKHIVKKVADKLKSLHKTERDNYEKFWDDIQVFIKFGCLKDDKFYDRIKDVILYKTIYDKHISLDEYLTARKDQEDKVVYYVTDENQQAQYIKQFKDNGLDALILDNSLDTPFMGLIEYVENMDKNPENQKEILKFARIDSDISKVLDSDTHDKDKENDEKISNLFKDVLGEKLASYKVESFKDSNLSAMVVVDEQSIRMAHMKDQFEAMGLGGVSFEEEQSLLLNRTSPIIHRLVQLSEDPDKKDLVGLMCQQVADLAMLANKELKPDQLNEYVDRTNKLMAMIIEK